MNGLTIPKMVGPWRESGTTVREQFERVSLKLNGLGKIGITMKPNLICNEPLSIKRPTYK